MNRIWTLVIALLVLVACGGKTAPCDNGPCFTSTSGTGGSGEMGGAGGAGGAFDPFPCPISDRLVCDECAGPNLSGAVCGIWGVCAAAGPFCLQPCNTLPNGSECAPGRHCQQLEQGKPESVCYPDSKP